MGGGLKLNNFWQALFPFDLFLFGKGAGGKICISIFCSDSKNAFPKWERKMLEIKISPACVDRPYRYQELLHTQK